MITGHGTTAVSFNVQHKLVTMVRTRLEYLTCLVESGLSADRLRDQREEIVNAIATQLRLVQSISTEVGVDLHRLIEHSHLTPDGKKAAFDNILAKVNPASQKDLAGIQRQTHDYFHEYLQKNHSSEQIVHPMTDTQTRLRMLALLARKLGVNNPSEQTMAKIAACAFADATHDEAQLLAGDLGLSNLNKFKAYLRALPVCAQHGVTVFPPFHQLEALYPAAFTAAGYTAGSNVPILDGAGSNIVRLIGEWIPKRLTRSTVGNSRSSPWSMVAPRQMVNVYQKQHALMPGLRHPQIEMNSPQPTRSLALCDARSLAICDRSPPSSENGDKVEKLVAATHDKEAAEANLLAEQKNNASEESAFLECENQTNEPRTINDMILSVKYAMQAKASDANGKKKAMKAVTPPTIMKKPSAAKQKSKHTRRSIHVEMSQSHILARTGLDTYPKSKAFKFTSKKDMPKAKQEAEKWLKSMGV